jgi:hypothetical protein
VTEEPPSRPLTRRRLVQVLGTIGGAGVAASCSRLATDRPGGRAWTVRGGDTNTDRQGIEQTAGAARSHQSARYVVTQLHERVLAG